MSTRTAPPTIPATSVELLADQRTIGELLSARAAQLPDKIFVVLPDDNAALTYAELERRARELAWALHGLGLRAGDRVAIALPNGAEAVVGWFACLLGGLVDTAISAELTGAPLRYSLEKVGASAVLTDVQHLEPVASHAAEAAESGGEPIHLVCHGLNAGSREQPTPWLHDLEQLVAAAQARDLSSAGFTDLASIRFTSGSTGMPKGIMMSPGHMRASAQMFCLITGFDRDDVLYSPFPLHHVLASVTGLLAVLEAGGTISLPRKFSASRFWPQVRSCGATVTHGLDPVVSILLKRDIAAGDRDHDVRCMYTAAGRYPEFEERFGVQLMRLFDMSELTAIARYRSGEEQREGSCGRESELFTVAVVDEHDKPVARGETGEIVVRPKVANVMMLGYYGDDEQTVRQWRNLWFHTGDTGHLDDDGYLYFGGRSADRIRHRGVNVSPGQIEAAASEDRDVAECAAIGVPSEVSEDEIKLCVQRPSGSQATVQEIATRLVAAMPDHLRPRYLQLYEALPRTDTEKIRKGVLRTEGKSGLTESTWDAQYEAWVEHPWDEHNTANADVPTPEPLPRHRGRWTDIG